MFSECVSMRAFETHERAVVHNEQMIAELESKNEMLQQKVGILTEVESSNSFLIHFITSHYLLPCHLKNTARSFLLQDNTAP